jgi:ABC-2 type transport system permease protein
MLGYGFVFFISAIVQSSAYENVAGHTAQSRAAFAKSMTVLASQLSYILPRPHHLDTLAGYVLWRSWGSLAVVIAVWVVISVPSAVRGDEEKQLVDSWLAAGVSRSRVVLYRLLGFGLAALVAALFAAVGTVLGAAGYDPVDLGGLMAQTLALWLLIVSLFAIAYLASQFPGSVRGAQLVAAAVIIAIYIANVVARTQSSLDWLGWWTPFGWYEKTDALVPGGHFDLAAAALSALVIVVAGGLSAALFNRRDVRGPLFIRRPLPAHVKDISPSPLLTWPVARLLYRQRWVLLAWMLGTVAMAAFMVSIARGVVDSLVSLPAMRAFLTHGAQGDPYSAYVSAFWFGIGQLLLAGFAIHMVAGWASEETEGVLVAVLSTPRSRWSVMVERIGQAVIAIAVVVAAGSVAAYLTAAALGIKLDPTGIWNASWLEVPLGLTFAAAGAAGTYWPRAAVGVLGLLAFVSFITYEIAPLVGWPDWVANLSVFRLYGNPLLSGIYWTGLWAMLAIVVVGFGLATLLMQRREIGR